jgi:hypothetical protein
MTDIAKTPTRLWVIGGLSALWYAYATFGCLMTVTRNDAFLSNLPGQQRAYFESFPAWANAAWALGVGGGLAGALLLLARSRHAVTAFGLSLAGLVVTTLYQFVLAPPPAEMRGTGMIVLNLVIWAIAIALILYARKQSASHVLR